MSRRKVEVECLACGVKFQSILRWEGVPEQDYCSKECEIQDAEGEETFEKFQRVARNSEW